MTFSFDTINNSQSPGMGANIRGEFGEALAQMFFVRQGYRVAPSQGDWYPYDMIVERHEETFRVQVKTLDAERQRFAAGKLEYPKVSFGKKLEFDWVFLLDRAGDIFVIPKEDITFQERPSGHRFTMYPTYDQFKVGQFFGFKVVEDFNGKMGIP